MPVDNAAMPRPSRRDSVQAWAVSEHLVRLGQVCRAQRKRLGLSQEELAAQLGTVRTVISKFERAQACPDFETLVGLCLALKLAPWILWPSPPERAAAVLLPLLAQMTEAEQWAVVTLVDVQVAPSSLRHCCQP